MMPEAASAPIDGTWVTVFVEINRRMTKILSEEEGMTVTQYRILLELADGGGVLPGSCFGQRLLLNHSSITGALAGLEEKGRIVREISPVSKREITVSITEQGTQAFKEATDAVVEALTYMWRDLSRDQINLIVASTREIVRTLKGYLPESIDSALPSYYVTAIVHVNSLWANTLRAHYRVSLTEFRILLELLTFDSKSRGVDLASALILDTSMISISIAKLERSGLVSREKDRFDKRNYHVHLTEEGERLAREASEEIAAINNGLYLTVSAHDRITLSGIAATMYQDF